MSQPLASLMRAARRRRIALLLVLGLIMAACVPSLLRLRVDPDVLNLLPQTGPVVRSFRTYLSSFGSLDRVYVVFEAPEGASAGDYTTVVDRFVEVIRGAPEISQVDAQVFAPGKDWTYLADRVFLLIGPEQTQQALRRLEPDGMQDRLAQARSRLAAPSPAIATLVRADPFDFFGLLRERMTSTNVFVQNDPTQEGYVSPDGRARLVIVTPTKPPFDSAFARAVVARLDAAARAAVAEWRRDEPEAPAPRIRFAGGYHVSIEAEREVRREAISNVIGSLAGILLLLVVVFRTPWLLLVGALPMTIAGVLSAAINGLWTDRLSAAAAGASALLFGLGIDGLVLMYARYLEERNATDDPMTAIARSAGTAASMLLGMTTTAATFLALTLVSFPSLQELGRLIGIGMLFGGPLTLLIVPALLPRRIRRHRAPFIGWLPTFVANRRAMILAGAAGATVLLAIASWSLHVDLSLQRLQPRTEQTAFEEEIARRFGLPRDLLVVVASGASLEPLLQRQARLESELRAALPGGKVSSAADWLPPRERQARVRAELTRFRPQLPEVPARVARAAAAAGFTPGAFQPFTERLPAAINPAATLDFQGYVQHGLGDLLAPYIARSEDGFVTVAYVQPRTPADIDVVRSVAERVDPSLQVTGLPVVNQELSARFLPQFVAGLAIGGVAVFVLMLLTFRSIPLTALALLPTVLGLIWSAGVLALLRVTLDLFSMFGVLTFIGIGVDYGIHLVHRYADREDLSESLGRIAPVNLTAAGIAILGCGTLITSHYPPLRSLGIVSVITLATCLVTSLLVLPALLMRPHTTRSAERGTRN